ncbi:ATP-binding response regulator [Haladaptatus sp. DFWS20]|uniref:ATP-binding response regulator n=1 Tax=Haladaptatus sp. DFWS20 TaxID=3403467 RepID=UPI003EB9E4FE
MSDTSSIVVLHVDNDPSLLDLTATFLERESEILDLRAASSGADALSIRRETEIDCIVSDYEMPEMDGLELLDAVRTEYSELLFILFTSARIEAVRNTEHTTGTATMRTATTETTRATANPRTTKAPPSDALVGGFYVENDDPWILESSREMVFETGYSTAETGTGIGLIIVKQIADAHEWDVSLDEAEGVGTRFEFFGVELATE